MSHQGFPPLPPLPTGAHQDFSPSSPPTWQEKVRRSLLGKLRRLYHQPWQGTIGLFPSEWACCAFLLSQSPLVWARGGEQSEGRGLTLMSWTQWSVEVPWTQRREGRMPAPWKALLMSVHFCCSASEMVHHCISVTQRTAGAGQYFLTQPVRHDPQPPGWPIP